MHAVAATVRIEDVQVARGPEPPLSRHPPRRDAAYMVIAAARSRGITVVATSSNTASSPGATPQSAASRARAKCRPLVIVAVFTQVTTKQFRRSRRRGGSLA
jgi:hypothetical protein